MEKYMKNLTAARLNAVALQAECPHTMLQFAPATKHKRLAIRLGGEILQNPGMCSVFFGMISLCKNMYGFCCGFVLVWESFLIEML